MRSIPRIHSGTLRARRRHRPDTLGRTRGRQERLQFENIPREALGCLGRAAQGSQRQLVGSRRAAESEIDAAREQALERSELFGDDIRGMIGEHDAARADPDALRPGRDMSNHDRGRRAGDARHVVVLRHP